MNENRKVSRLEGYASPVGTEVHEVTDEDLCHEYKYDLASKALKKLLLAGIITQEEFNKIDAKNRESFSPHLADLMPKTVDI